MALTMLGHVGGDLAEARPYREAAQRQVGHLVRMADDLLDVSRLTRGSVELRMEAVDLAAVVESAVSAARPAIEARGMRFPSSCPDSFRLVADALDSSRCSSPISSGMPRPVSRTRNTAWPSPSTSSREKVPASTCILRSPSTFKSSARW